MACILLIFVRKSHAKFNRNLIKKIRRRSKQTKGRGMNMLRFFSFCGLQAPGIYVRHRKPHTHTHTHKTNPAAKQQTGV